MPKLLTQGHVRKRQFPIDGRFIQKLDAASHLNMEAVLEMKITLKQKKNVINAAHLKVRSCFVFLLFLFIFFCVIFRFIYLFASMFDCFPFLKFCVLFFNC